MNVLGYYVNISINIMIPTLAQREMAGDDVVDVDRFGYEWGLVG